MSLVFIIGSSNRIQKVQRRAEIDNELISEINDDGILRDELRIATMRIKQLEKRLAEFEMEMPKKYKPVKFQNYINRKRILVSRVR